SSGGAPRRSVGDQAVPCAVAGPAARGHLHHRPAAAAGAVPRRIPLPGRPGGLGPAAAPRELAPPVIAAPRLAPPVPRDAARASPAGCPGSLIGAQPTPACRVRTRLRPRLVR